MIEAKCGLCGYTVACRDLPKGYLSEIEWAGDKLSQHAEHTHPKRKQLEIIETKSGRYASVYEKRQPVLAIECTLCGYSETVDSYFMESLPTDLDGDLSWGEIVLRRHIAVAHPDICNAGFELKHIADTVVAELADNLKRPEDIPSLPLPEVHFDYEKEKGQFDPVDRPEHYASGKIECIDWITEMLTDEELRGYLKGNMLKYLWRHEHKGNPAQDLKKCIWYAERLLSLGAPEDGK